MNTKDLKCFLQVCSDGSITKAAKSLFITPQGLSKIIINLEQELKIPLFYRTPNGLNITEYGELLQEKAKHIISELEGIEIYFDNLDNISGQISLASSYGVIAALSPKFLFEFRKRFPNINLKWKEYSDIRAEKAIWDGDADCGLIKGPISHNQLESIKLAFFKPMILIPKNHKLASKKAIQINDLKNEPIILEGSEFKIFHNFMKCCKDAGFIPNIAFETTELSLAHKLCQQGLGLAITVDFAAVDMPLADFVALPFKKCGPKWEIYFVTKKQTVKSPSVRFFEDHINEYIKTNFNSRYANPS